MDYIDKILKKPNRDIRPEEAILILGDRLQHSKFSTDRRSAVLGLKSFSRQYREVVVEYASKALLKTLIKDGDDIVSLKAILETLLILFTKGSNTGDETKGWISSQSRIQSGKYPSPMSSENFEVDQFSLWIADEFTASSEYLTCLMESLQDHTDFHVRSYAIQLLQALLLTRPAKTKDLFTTIPSSISSAVSVLNDEHDQIRCEAVLFLMALVKDNHNIQKVVAFENTFDTLFKVIREEGGIRGSIIVQDCLTLFYNLLAYNASNQTFFLETGCVPQLVDLLSDQTSEENESKSPLERIAWHDQRVSNVKLLLEICRTFVEKDNQDLLKRQNTLFECGLFFCVLKLVFAFEIENSLRSLALQVAGDLMMGNTRVQYEFSKLDVPDFDPSLPHVSTLSCVSAPQALLNWALLLNSVRCFNIRLLASFCFQCFVENNEDAKLGFLEDQIRTFENQSALKRVNGDQQQPGGEKADGFSIRYEQANMLSVLLHYDDGIKLNPYKPWFAAFFMISLIHDSEKARQCGRAVKVGNEEAGEEVMGFIQAISQILVTTLDLTDLRVTIAYTSLLSFWLFEDFEAVDDFLGDMDTVKAIMSVIMKNGSDATDMADCSNFILIGIAYEFSRISSPCPRPELHNIIIKSLGAENYALKVKKMFKEYTEDRVDNIFTQDHTKDETGLPKVFFIPHYLQLIQQNQYRIKLALLHDPKKDPILRITHEIYEDLEEKYEELKKTTVAKELVLLKSLDDYKARVADLESLLQGSNQKLESVNSESANLRERLKSFVASEHASRQEVKELLQSESILRQRLTETEAGLKTETQKLEALLRELKTLKFQLEEAISSKESAENGIIKMNRELKGLSDNFHSSKAELKAVKDSFALSSKESESKIRYLTSEVERLQNFKLGYEEKHHNNEDELHRAHQRIGLLEAAFEDAVSGKAQQASEVKSLIEKLKSAALMVHGLKRQLSTKEAEINDLKSEYNSCQYLELSTNDERSTTEGILGHESKKGADDPGLEAAELSRADESKGAREDRSGDLPGLKLELEKENSYLKSSLKAERERLRASQSEFDELMLLWEIQGTKLESYRRRFKNLEISVSSDDD